MLDDKPVVPRVFIVENHALAAEGIRSVLEKAHYEIVGLATTAQDAIAAIGALDPVPDVVLADISLARLESGFDVHKWIRANSISTKTIMVTMYDDRAFVRAAFRLQVDGFVSKNDLAESLVTANRTVLDGGRYVSPFLVSKVIEAYQTRAGSRLLDPYDEILTKRHRQLVNLVGQGLDLREAAVKMGVRYRTVVQYRAEIMRRIGLTSYIAFAQWAYKTMQEVLMILGSEAFEVSPERKN